MDLSAVSQSYDGCNGGYLLYHPEMMLALLIYAYHIEVPSSRRIEKAAYDLTPSCVLTTRQHPGHDTITNVSSSPSGGVRAMFIQVLRVCQETGSG